MRVLFVDNDPVMRGLLHCMATMAGLDHAIVASGQEALAVLRGQRAASADSWSIDSASVDRIALVVTELDLPDMHGNDLAVLVRKEQPETMIFAHTSPEAICGGDLFERMFCKPHSAEAVVRAALGVVGNQSDRDLFHTLIPEVGMPAA